MISQWLSEIPDEFLLKSKETTAFQQPSSRNYRSVRTWFRNIEPIIQREQQYIRLKEDIVTLRHGREWAGFDGLVESILQKFDCRLIRVCFFRPCFQKLCLIAAVVISNPGASKKDGRQEYIVLFS